MPARLRCPACGVRYSARASGARCPECGERNGEAPRRRSRRWRSSGAGGPLLAVGAVAVVVLAVVGVGWAVWRTAGQHGNDPQGEARTGPGPGPVVSWELKEFSPPGGRFTVLMPGGPEKSEWEDGLRFTQYKTEGGGRAFVVGYANLVRGGGINLDGDVREFVRARNPGLSRPIPSHNHWQGQPIDPINGKVRYEGSETLSDGWREFEGDITDPPGHMAGRVLFTRGRLYFFYEAGGDARRTNPETRKFIDSFRLTDGPAPWRPAGRSP